MDAASIAWNARNTALRDLRFKRLLDAYATVLRTDEELVKAVAAKRINPPDPKQGFEYGGIAYRLQSYVGGNARYVKIENYDTNEYRFEYPDLIQKVRDEISVSAQVEFEISIIKEYYPELPIDSL